MRIDESMKLFLKETSDKLSPKTVQKYEYVLDLFYDYLLNYSSLSNKKDNKDEDTPLPPHTQELHEGQVANFLEWFLIKKVIGPAWLNTSAPGIIQKYTKWLGQKGLLTKGYINGIIETTKKATKDLPRVEKAASALYRLCDKDSEIFESEKYDLEDKDYMEGYGEVIRIIEDKLYLDYEGEKIGPIKITKDIARYLKKGDTVNLAIIRKGKVWYPVEVGNVYPA